MKRHLYVFLSILFANCLRAGDPPYPKGFEAKKQNQSITFIENKGQVSDQFNKARPDVLFGGTANGMVFHLRNNGISYQLRRVDTWKEEDTTLNPNIIPGRKRMLPDQISIYRLDMNWLNCNKNPTTQTIDPLPGYTNYYQEVCQNGVHQVKTYASVLYKNIYNNIDLRYYEKSGCLKYDFIVSPHADYKQIQLQIQGAQKIQIQKDGSVLIKTPLGEITEGVPIVFQNGTQLLANWILEDGVLRLDIPEYIPGVELLIDPLVRFWGTYFGGSEGDIGFTCTTDLAGNVYLTGYSSVGSSTAIATSGAHQTTLAGTIDAILVKFNSSGIRQWSTYYGGASTDIGHSCAIDVSGNVFLCGVSHSTLAISTPGSHQPVNGGMSDAYLVKFNPAGVRQWGTYYGGPLNDGAITCAMDGSGNIFICGSSATNFALPFTTVIATPGSHQPIPGGGLNDGYLAKFNTNGVRLWGTYYGGTGGESSWCNTDAAGNVYISGATWSTGTTIATPGTHQSTIAGGAGDAYLAKFNNSGVRQWGTYYGGNVTEEGRGLVVDNTGNIYMVGITNSSTGISTPGCHQPNFAGSGNLHDGFIVKFNSSGSRLWGTYYGDVSNNLFNGRPALDVSGNLIAAGNVQVSSSTIIATPGSHQPNFGGVQDGYLVQFSPSGTRLWATFYGGSDGDDGYCSATDQFGHIYLCGTTASSVGTSIASPGSHQSIYGGEQYDAYLVQFGDCSNPPLPVNSTQPPNQVLCPGYSTTLNAAGTGTIFWYSTPTGTAVLGTGTVFTTATLSPGTHTFYAESYSCAPSASRTAITVTVLPPPVITVSSGAICVGQSYTISPTGANTYTISGGNFVVNPTTNTNYSVTGTSTAGCVSTAVVCSVMVNPLPNVAAVSNPSAVCLGENAILTASGANNYVWNPSGNTSTISVTPNANTTYSVTGTNNNGCSYSAIISISVKPNPTVSVNNATICTGTQAVLNASVNPNTGIIYNWLPGGESTSSLVVNPNSTTVYSVSVSLDGCTSVTTSTVNVVTAITPNAAFSYNGPYCTSQNSVSPTLNPAFSGGGVFNSSSGLIINSNTGAIDLANSTPGIYQVTYTLAASGCSTSASGIANIQVTLPSQLNLAPQVTILTGESYTLNVSGGSSYTWTPSTYLSCTDCDNPIASPPQSMTYCVSSSNDLCIAKTCITIKVETGCEGRELTLPNAFTPNGDGSNDEFCLKGWNRCIAEFNVMVFDRWGEKVFESTDPNFCWDGYYKGKILESDVFVYLIKATFNDGTKTNMNGNITLIR